MSQEQGASIREWGPGDEQALLARPELWGAEAERIPRSPLEWRRRHVEAPAGPRLRVACDASGEPLAALAGIPLQMRVEGERETWTLVVGPPAPAAAERARAAERAGRAFLEAHGGPSPRDAVLFALPSRAAWLAGKRLFEWEIVRAQCALSVAPDALAGPGANGSPRVDVEEVARAPADLEGLFARAAEGRRAIAVRDAAWLAWRFPAGGPYALALARRAGELQGYAVHRRGGLGGEAGSTLCDWLVPPGEDGAAAELLRWVAERARADGSERIATLLPECSPEWRSFQRAGFRARPTPWSLAARSFQRRHDDLWLLAHWHYTPADTDLC